MGFPGSGARLHDRRPAVCCSGAAVALDVLVDRENREVQTDHHSADHGPHDEDHDRFDRSGEGLGGAVDFPVIEIGNLVEHLTDLTAFFSHFDHLRDHLGEDFVPAHGGGHRLPVAYGRLDIAHGDGDDLVARRLADHGQRLHDGDTHVEQQAEVAGEPAHRQFGGERAEDRQAQFHLVDSEPEVRARADLPFVDDRSADAENEDQRADPPHVVAHVDQELGDRRQFAAQILEHLFEDRDDEDEHCRDHHEGEGQHDRRIGQRALDFAAERGVFLQTGGDLFQRRVDHAARLAGADHGHHQGRKDLVVLAHGRRQRHARRDIRTHLAGRLFQRGRRGLLLEDGQRPQQRHARRRHRGELPGEDRQVLELGPVAQSRDLEVPVHALAGLAQLQWHLTAGPQHVGGRGLVRRLHGALGLAALRVDAVVVEGLGGRHVTSVRSGA